MNRFTTTFVKLGSAAALALGSVAITSAAFAASQPSTISATSRQAQVDHHAMMAADYRARVRIDEKHAISWSTQAAHCDLKAEQLRVAAL